MKRRKLSSRSRAIRKSRKNPSEYGIAPLIIAGILGLVGTMTGGALSNRKAKKDREAAAQLAEQQAQEESKKRTMWYVLGGIGAGTVLIVGLYAISKSGSKDDK